MPDAPELEAAGDLGARLHARIAELYPICRSITGPGVRETLGRLQALIPLRIHEVPTGTPVFDWTVPREWAIRDAYVARADGTRVIDFRRHNLHVMSYSTAVRARMRLNELAPAPLFRPGPSGLDPLPHRLLRRGLGLLPLPPPARGADGGGHGRGLRGGDRRHPRPRVAQLWRMPGPRRDRRRGPHLGPCLPPLARQRQPVGHRDRGRARPAPGARVARATRTASSSSPAPSARSPGSRGTRRRSGRSATA